MWQHEISEAFSNLELSPDAGLTFQIIKSSLQAIEDECPAFYFGDFSQVESAIVHDLGSKSRKIEDIPCEIHEMPFDRFFVEFTVLQEPVEGQYLAPKRAVYFERQKNTNGDVCLVCQAFYQYGPDFPYNITPNRWSLAPIPWAYMEGQGWRMNAPQADRFRNASQEEQNLVASESFDDILTSLFLLRVLRCRNIVIRTVEPPIKLNAKRLKAGKFPLHRYKILEVTPGAVKQQDGGTVDWGYKQPSELAFHLCRGHFKTYTSEAPLFGKITGTFWWQGFARGDKANGILQKDYRVKTD